MHSAPRLGVLNLVLCTGIKNFAYLVLIILSVASVIVNNRPRVVPMTVKEGIMRLKNKTKTVRDIGQTIIISTLA